MEIRRVRAFRTIVEASNLTRAAGLLGMTPGALSKSMQQLERDVGRKLFVKQGRTLGLSEHGKLLYNESAGLLDEHARVLRRMDSSRDDGGPTLRLATYEVFTTHTLGALLANGLDVYALQIFELSVGELERAIAEHEADVGITYVPVPRRGLEFRPVGEITFQAYTKPGAFQKTPFKELPFVIPTTTINETLSDVLGMDCWPYERVPRNARYRVTSMECALELCRLGLCAAFLPSFVVLHHNRRQRQRCQLVARRSSRELGTIKRQVYVVYRGQEAGTESVETVARATAAAIESNAN